MDLSVNTAIMRKNSLKTNIAYLWQSDDLSTDFVYDTSVWINKLFDIPNCIFVKEET